MIFLSVLTSGLALADRHDFNEPVHTHIDARHGHNHSDVDRGAIVHELPPQAVWSRFAEERYWFHAGVWYRAGLRGYIVVAPPAG